MLTGFRLYKHHKLPFHIRQVNGLYVKQSHTKHGEDKSKFKAHDPEPPTLK